MNFADRLTGRAQNGGLPRHLEDAFIKVSFEELKERLPKSGDVETGYNKWIENASAQRAATDLWGADMFKKLHPNHSLVIGEAGNNNILGYPHLLVEPLNLDDMVTTTLFFALPRSSSSVPGMLIDDVTFGAFRIAWDKYEFLLYVARIGFSMFQYILHEGPRQPSRDLLMAVGLWQAQLHNEIWVFNQGFWHKDSALWQELQKADWKDVILEKERKETMHNDIYGFFKSEHVYKELSIPWKRGIIMHGPPGNGKTISIKAIMKECDSKGFAPLYVKSFQSWMGEEASMQMVFDKARNLAPCVVIFEDLDSLITDQNRSFFLNQLDGFEGNDGLLCIGTTNHYDRLDPALKTRPSRFDRKYLFDDPTHDERILYAQYWQKKLSHNKSIAFPDSLVQDVADLTDKFSFAYLKEAFVSTLFLIATSGDEDKPSFDATLKKTIKQLRKQLDKNPSEGSLADSVPAARHTTRPAALPPKPERDLAAMARTAVAIGRGFIY